MSILGGMQGHTGGVGIIFMCSSTDGGVVEEIDMEKLHNFGWRHSGDIIKFKDVVEK